MVDNEYVWVQIIGRVENMKKSSQNSIRFCGLINRFMLTRIDRDE